MLEEKVYAHEPVEDKDAIQEMGKNEYHEEDPTIISEESDDEVEDEYGKKIENEANKEVIINDEPIKDEDDEDSPSAIGKCVI